MPFLVEIEGTSELVTLWRTFATSTLRVLGADDAEIERVRPLVSQLAGALVAAGIDSSDGARLIPPAVGDE